MGKWDFFHESQNKTCIDNALSRVASRASLSLQAPATFDLNFFDCPFVGCLLDSRNALLLKLPIFSLNMCGAWETSLLGGGSTLHSFFCCCCCFYPTGLSFIHSGSLYMTSPPPFEDKSCPSSLPSGNIPFRPRFIPCLSPARALHRKPPDLALPSSRLCVGWYDLPQVHLLVLRDSKTV